MITPTPLSSAGVNSKRRITLDRYFQVGSYLLPWWTPPFDQPLPYPRVSLPDPEGVSLPCQRSGIMTGAVNIMLSCLEASSLLSFFFSFLSPLGWCGPFHPRLFLHFSNPLFELTARFGQNEVPLQKVIIFNKGDARDGNDFFSMMGKKTIETRIGFTLKLHRV